MKTETTIKTNIDDLKVLYFEFEGEDIVGEPMRVPGDMTEEELAKKLNCSKELIGIICFLVDNIRELLQYDLKDIWERIDRLEEKIDC